MPANHTSSSEERSPAVPVFVPYLNKGLEYGLVAFAFLVPFAALNNLLEYFFFVLMIVWILRETGLRRWHLRGTPIDLPLALFLGWILVTVIFATDPEYSFAEWRKTATRVLMLYFVVQVIEGPERVRAVVVALVCGAGLQSIFTVVKFFAEGSGPLDMSWRADALTESSQWLSTYLVMSLPFFWLVGVTRLGVAWRWVWGIGAALALSALFLAHTRGALVAFVIQVLVLLVLKQSRSGVLAAGAAALALTTLFLVLALPGTPRETLMQSPLTETGTMAIRFKTWAMALSEIGERPLTGFGYGRHSLSQAHPDLAQHGYHTHVHNAFLSSAVQVGVPGFLLFGWLFGRIVRVFYEQWTRLPDQYAGQLALAGLLMTTGVVVRNLFDDMFVGTIVYLFWLLVGVIVASRRNAVDAHTPAS